MKRVGWFIVISGILFQYLIAAYIIPTPREFWLGLPVAVLCLFSGFIVSWLGFIVNYKQGGLSRRTMELDDEYLKQTTEHNNQ